MATTAAAAQSAALATQAAPAAAPAAGGQHQWPLPPSCGPDPERLAALDKAISLARPNFGSLAKNETADIKGRKHGYLNLPGLYEATVSALLTQGVVVTNSIDMVQGGFLIVTTLHDLNKGGWRQSSFPIVNLSGGSSAIAAAATTAPRINLQLLLGICAQDDEVDAPAAAVAPWNAPATAGGSWEAPAAMQAAQPAAPGPAMPSPMQGQGQQWTPAGYAPQGQLQGQPQPQGQPAPQQQQPQPNSNPYANF